MSEKAISLTQPWALMVILQEKGFETRGRRFNHRGRVWIHATKTMPDYAVRLFEEDPFFLAFRARQRIRSRKDLDFGAILGRVDVMACDPVEEVRHKISDSERAFGNYDHGRYAIRLGAVQRLVDPVECGGMQAMPWPVPELPGILKPVFKEDTRGPTQAILRASVVKGDTARYRDIDWHEHAGHENGAYVNVCMDCNVDFVGHKRCVLCRRCWFYRGQQPP